MRQRQDRLEDEDAAAVIRLKTLRIGSLLLSSALVALALVATPATAAPVPPFVKHGTLTISHGKVTDLIGVKFQGTLPNLKKGEYVAYMGASLDGPSGPDQCNTIGIDTIGRSKPRHTKVWLDPSIGMEWPSNVAPQWCKGRWIVQAFVYKPDGKGAYRPRLAFARKTFSVG
jgi:hypothetical protein